MLLSRASAPYTPFRPQVKANLLQAEGSDLPVWLDVLSTLLTRSAPRALFQQGDFGIDVGEIAEQYSFFPLFLAGLGVRQVR